MAAVTGQMKAQGFIREWKEMVQRPERLVWRNTIRCRFEKNMMQIVGEGAYPHEASVAAFMGFMYQLHVFGWLKQILEQEAVQKALEQRKRTFAWTAEDIAAKMHIHNFAARYYRSPKLEFDELDEKSIKATVVIPDTEYTASAIAEGKRKAEFLAYAALKETIQEKFALEGQTVDVQDNNFVNLDNAKAILRLYKLRQHFGHFQALKEKVPGPDSATWASVQIYWDDRPLSATFEMPSDRDANTLAALDAAVRLVTRHPELLSKYQKLSKDTGGLVPMRATTTFASLTPDVIATLSDCIEVAEDAKLNEFELKSHEIGHKPHVGDRWTTVGGSENRFHAITQSLAARSDELRTQQEWDRENPNIVEAMAAREKLPIYQSKAQILAMVKNHDQCIVVGSTGSGKSTQVPQIILDDAIAEGRGALCNVICTQPRRISSVALALTVCQERDRDVGDMIGYRIGGDYYNSSKKGGSITYCTTELLANELERAEDELPHNVSHIIVDEIHERSGDMDRLLSTIKLAFSKRLSQGKRVPKLVLMSATVESDLFERYFEMVTQDGTAIRPPYLNVPGRMHKTDTKFLESFENQLPSDIYRAIERADQQQTTPSSEPFPPPAEKTVPTVQWESASQSSRRGLVTQDSINAVAATIAHIVETTKGGAILAFVPGASEIRLVHQTLLEQKRFDFANGEKYEILMLHRFNPAHLVKALNPVAEGIRRILISTNIAETSITFPGIEYVVDSGLKRSTTDMTVGPVQILRDERISRASVLQRAGRAGRTKPGYYYGTFTTDEMRNLDVFSNAQDNTLDRVQNAYLRARVHFPSVPVQKVFDSYLTPISAKKVAAAEKFMKDIGALTEEGEVSMIGYIMYRTTLAPAVARMVLLGIQFRCLDRAVILATLMSMKFNIFDDVNFEDATPSDRRKAAERFGLNSRSDVIAQMRAVEAYQEAHARDPASAREWATEQGIAFHHFDHIQARIEAVRRVLYRAGFFKQGIMGSLNASTNNLTILKMLICAGSYPNIASHKHGATFITHQALLVRPAPTSLALPGDYLNPETWARFQKELVGSIFCYRHLFSSKSGSSNYGMDDLTPITPLMLALFSPNVKKRHGKLNQLIIDDIIPLQFSGDADAASTFLEFKQVFDVALLSGLQGIAEMWGTDKRKTFKRGFTELILGAVQELLEYEEGQAQRREDDVDNFILSPEKREAWPAAPAEQPWQPMHAEQQTRDSEVICSICGQMGHVYDDCPRNAVTSQPQQRAPTADGRRSGTLAPWDPAIQEGDAAAPWTPNLDEVGLAREGDFHELPGDADLR
jgi:HrpA-like RNA helicase